MGVPDRAWMSRALRIAERGWGRVQPNPLVGALVLDAAGRLVGEGAHLEYGGPHAEVNAINRAGAAARGGTLVVSLEPCNHHGKTPPCSDAVLRAGIARVVYGARDPNTVAGGGAERLAAAGVRVEGPVATQRVRAQNAIFFHTHEHTRSFVALKLAATLDSRISRTRGRRTMITGSSANEETHRLRAGFDAIMVGRGTVTADDPLLSVRGEVMPRSQPVRVVLDSDARLSPDSRIVNTTALAPVWVFCAHDADLTRRRALERHGVRTIPVARAGEGVDIDEVLATLWTEEIRSVFCEGGALVAGSLARADRIDRLYLFVAPNVMGEPGVGAFEAFTAGPTPLKVSAARRCGDDALLVYDRITPVVAAGAPGPRRAAARSADVYRAD
jgi:diaminohydroxyphosphoribosylaminopyrimidine deaminase/5-amino-6-(5-phosphoribosylamino)uracil reductase